MIVAPVSLFNSQRITIFTDMKEDINLENAIDYIEAIEKAVSDDAMKVAKGERSLAISIVAATLSVAADSLKQYQAKLEASGLSTPITEEQKTMIRRTLQAGKKLN